MVSKSEYKRLWALGADMVICGTCNGSGEGQTDGSTCPNCFGIGEEPREKVNDDI